MIPNRTYKGREPRETLEMIKALSGDREPSIFFEAREKQSSLGENQGLANSVNNL